MIYAIIDFDDSASYMRFENKEAYESYRDLTGGHGDMMYIIEPGLKAKEIIDRETKIITQAKIDSLFGGTSFWDTQGILDELDINHSN